MMQIERPLRDLIVAARAGKIGELQLKRAEAWQGMLAEIANAWWDLCEMGSPEAAASAETVLDQALASLALRDQAEAIWPIGWWPGDEGGVAGRVGRADLSVEPAEGGYVVMAYLGERPLVEDVYDTLREGFAACIEALADLVGAVPALSPEPEAG